MRKQTSTKTQQVAQTTAETISGGTLQSDAHVQKLQGRACSLTLKSKNLTDVPVSHLDSPLQWLNHTTTATSTSQLCASLFIVPCRVPLLLWLCFLFWLNAVLAVKLVKMFRCFLNKLALNSHGHHTCTPHSVKLHTLPKLNLTDTIIYNSVPTHNLLGIKIANWAWLHIFVSAVGKV